MGQRDRAVGDLDVADPELAQPGVYSSSCPARSPPRPACRRGRRGSRAPRSARASGSRLPVATAVPQPSLTRSTASPATSIIPSTSASDKPRSSTWVMPRSRGFGLRAGRSRKDVTGREAAATAPGRLRPSRRRDGQGFGAMQAMALVVGSIGWTEPALSTPRTRGASVRWPGRKETIVAERAWSEALVTVPCLKPAPTSWSADALGQPGGGGAVEHGDGRVAVGERRALLALGALGRALDGALAEGPESPLPPERNWMAAKAMPARRISAGRGDGRHPGAAPRAGRPRRRAGTPGGGVAGRGGIGARRRGGRPGGVSAGPGGGATGRSAWPCPGRPRGPQPA